jgi:hypothetical protein
MRLHFVADGIEWPDGSRLRFVNIRPLENERRAVTGAINCFYDITARNQTEERLRQSPEDSRGCSR